MSSQDWFWGFVCLGIPFGIGLYLGAALTFFTGELLEWLTGRICRLFSRRGKRGGK